MLSSRWLAIAAAAALLLGSGSEVANAGDLALYHYDGVNIRTGPATSYTSLGLGYDLQEGCTWAYAQGESINGNTLCITRTTPRALLDTAAMHT